MSLTFWFDVHSPWVYLAAHRIGDLARKHDLPLLWRPLHLPRLLDQIFANLLSNAIKYSGTSRRIDVSVTGNALEAEVRVRDYGIGVPADEVGRLFTRFFRASTAKGLPGTGIGLNLVKELVSLHGGDVRVESAAGEGSCFIVTLPTRARPAAAASGNAAD